MCRLGLALVLIALLYLADARRCSHSHSSRHCDRHRHHHERNIFEEIADDLIAVERKLQNFCNDNGNFNATEIYGSDDYRIKIPVQYLAEDNIEAKVKGRVLHISASQEEMQGEKRKPQKKKTVQYISILPQNVVTAYPAAWYLSENELSIVFPYKVKLNDEASRPCDVNILEGVVLLSKADDQSPVSVPQVDEEKDIQLNVIP